MLLLAISMIAQLKAGNASRYGYVGDTLDNVGSFACRGSLEGRYGSRVWRTMRDHGVANRTLPCGTPLGVCNPRTSLCTTAYVVDRGPWGALDRRGVWHARITLKKGEHYRGELDLLPGVYTAIGLVGIERVWFWPLPKEEPPPLPPRTKTPRLRAAGPSRYAMSFSPLQTPLAFK